MDCHTDTQIRGGFHRKLNARLVVLYRNDWVASVARKRAANARQLDASAMVCYKHINFRSQLAAQWGVLFDCLGLPYQYQPDLGLEADGDAPDFFLPNMDFKPEQDRHKGVFLIVSNEHLSEHKIAKANNLRDRLDHGVYLFHGSAFEDGLYCWGTRAPVVIGKSISPVWVEQCPFCGEFEFSFKSAEPEDRLLSVHSYCLEECIFAKEYDVMSWFLDCQTHLGVRAYSTCHSPMLDLAYEAAKSARFEDPRFSSEVRGIGLAIRKLREQRVFCTNETMATIREIARTLRSDPACPTYEEPWYVPHLAHLRSGSRAACPCYSCDAVRNRTPPSL